MMDKTKTSLVGTEAHIADNAQISSSKGLFDMVKRLNEELGTMPIDNEEVKRVQESLDQLNNMMGDYSELMRLQHEITENAENDASPVREVYKNQSLLGKLFRK